MAANIYDILQEGIRREASDIHLAANQRPFFRELGVLMPSADDNLTAEFMQELSYVMLNNQQRQKLASKRELDFSYEFNHRRFRGNFYYQQGSLALALRLLPDKIPTLAEINSPKALNNLLNAEQGLILVCGRTGSGKTTTIASFLNAINDTRPVHIVTLEDPLEYIYQPNKAFISQRELGRDFISFSAALRAALREMPDIILVGEIRDTATMRTALMAAETGMLVVGTLHSRKADEVVARIEGMFAAAEQTIIRAQLAEVLAGIFTQQLVSGVDGKRVCLTEVLLANTAVKSLIKQGKYSQLESVMLSQGSCGMQTRTAAINNLFAAGKITAATRDNLLAVSR